MQPKISVVIPIYNVQNYLRKCVDSVLAQDLKDIEIILVDDGATDASGQMLEEHYAHHPQIKIIHQKNGGLSDARNAGLAIAQGDYLAFVDGDDYIAPHMMGLMHALATKHQADIVICDLQRVDECGKLIKHMPQTPNLPEVFDLKEHTHVFSDIAYFACNKLFHNRLFKDKKFEKGIHFEDIALVPQLLLAAKRIAKTDQALYYYLERSDSISKSHSLKGLDMLKAVEGIVPFFQNSAYAHEPKVLKNFLILEGVYSFLAYLAFVKNWDDYSQMYDALGQLRQKHQLGSLAIARYQRFGKNYLGGLPWRKKLYYGLYLLGQKKLIYKILNR
jgi:glycosyltransferase involved in cell wall biosynthesis